MKMKKPILPSFSTLFLVLAVLFYLPLSAQSTFLWKISNKDSNNTSYLLGTHHLLGESFVDGFPVIEDKIKSCSFVITETEIDWKKLVGDHNARPSTDSLEQMVSKEDYDYIKDMFKDTRTDVTKLTPGELWQKIAICYVIKSCTVLNPKDTFHMDEYIQKMAADNNKTPYYLETNSDQSEILVQATNFIDWKYFKTNISSTLKSLKKVKVNEKYCSTINNYVEFKEDYKFKKSCNSLSESDRILLTDRNNKWMQKLPELISNNNCFIAVGLAHLRYECGLIQQLRDLGYSVEPIQMKS